VPKFTITYDHPQLGPIQVKDVAEAHVNPLYSNVTAIAFKRTSGQTVTMTTNVPFVVWEEQDAETPSGSGS
jgi:hypothetical protein